MTKKTRKKFTEQEKRVAVNDYVSGAKTAQQIATELGTDTHAIYRWKTLFEEEAKGVRIEELERQGCSPQMAKRMALQEEEIALYQKKVAEQAVIIDLLKKLRSQKNSAPESELSGLIATTKKSDRNKRRLK